MNELLESLVLTKTAIDYVVKNAQPVIAPDFVGYLTGVDDKGKVMIAISCTGVPLFFYRDPKKVLKPRQIGRLINRLIRKKFLQMIIEPFPEYSPYFNLPLKISRAKIYTSPLFRSANQ